MRRCERIRDRLLAAPASAEVLDHLRDCRACSRFAHRAQEVREGLRDHHAGIEPDAGFAGRVAARARRQPSVVLGWAATRLLPATLAAMLVLAWFASRGDSTEGGYEAAEEDVLTWVLQDAGGEW